MNDIERKNPGARYSESVSYNNIVYLAGMVPDDYSGGIEEQARQAFEN